MLTDIRKRVQAAHGFYDIPKWKLYRIALKTINDLDLWSLEVAKEARKGNTVYACTEDRCIVVWDTKKKSGQTLGPVNCPCHALEDPRGEEIS